MKIEGLRPYLKYIPEVKRPSRALTLKEKLSWVALALGLFYVLGVIRPYGITEQQMVVSGFEILQMVTASHIGSLITAGIGPIVVGSIMLQLLVGTGVIELDLTRNEDKALFQGAQKILIVIFSILEAAAISVAFGLEGSIYWIVVLQIAMGSIILMFLDEIVSKYGIGSGIGLFIAGGVSQTIITAIINPLPKAEALGEYAGVIPNVIVHLISGHPEYIISLFSLFATIVTFLVVVYGESLRLEIPLAYGTIRGISARYPIKFFYVSNIPVILAAALIQTLALVPGVFGIHPGMESEMNTFQQAIYIFFSYITSGYGSANSLYGILNPSSSSIDRLLDVGVILHIIIYSAVFLIMCVFFGKFWAATTNIGPEKIAQQIYQSGLQIPGFRRDIRVIQHVLERYIPQMVVISSIAVGLLALIADFLGAFGTGTGILLTVGILYRMYEQLQREEMGDMPVWFRELFGKK